MLQIRSSFSSVTFPLKLLEAVSTLEELKMSRSDFSVPDLQNFFFWSQPKKGSWSSTILRERSFDAVSQKAVTRSGMDIYGMTPFYHSLILIHLILIVENNFRCFTKVQPVLWGWRIMAISHKGTTHTVGNEVFGIQQFY